MFGEELREAREQRGISLDDVSVATRVSLRHLHALEANEFAELPGGVFNRGIVRSYAKFCGLDEESTVQGFTQAMRERGLDTDLKEGDWVEFAEAVRRNRVTDTPPRKLRWLGVVGMLLGVLVLAVAVLWVLVRRGVVHLPQKTRFIAIHAMYETPKRFGIS